MILRSTLTALCLFALPAAALAQAAAPATASATTTAATPKRSHMKKIVAVTATTTTATTATSAPTATPTAAPIAAKHTRIARSPAAAVAPAAAAAPVMPTTAAAPAGFSKSGKPRTEKQLAADLKRKACANDWQNAKKANTTGGKTWPQFLSACYKTKV